MIKLNKFRRPWIYSAFSEASQRNIPCMALLYIHASSGIIHDGVIDMTVPLDCRRWGDEMRWDGDAEEKDFYHHGFKNCSYPQATKFHAFGFEFTLFVFFFIYTYTILLSELSAKRCPDFVFFCTRVVNVR